jgi:hypothetical protein
MNFIALRQKDGTYNVHKRWGPSRYYKTPIIEGTTEVRKDVWQWCEANNARMGEIGFMHDVTKEVSDG